MIPVSEIWSSPAEGNTCNSHKFVQKLEQNLEISGVIRLRTDLKVSKLQPYFCPSVYHEKVYFPGLKFPVRGLPETVLIGSLEVFLILLATTFSWFWLSGKVYFEGITEELCLTLTYRLQEDSFCFCSPTGDILYIIYYSLSPFSNCFHLGNGGYRGWSQRKFKFTYLATLTQIMSFFTYQVMRELSRMTF